MTTRGEYKVPTWVAWLFAATTVACVGIKPRNTPPQTKIDAATLYGLRIYHGPLDLQGAVDLILNVCLTADGAIERVEYSANMQPEAALRIAEKITQAWSYQAYVPPGQTKGVAVCGLIAPEELAALDAPKPPAVHIQPPTDNSDVAAVVAANPITPNLVTPNLATPATSDAPTFIAPTAIEQLRIAGIKHIMPDNATATRMYRLKVSTVRAGIKLCLAADGTNTSTTILTSSGFGDYDRKIITTIRDTWKYRPFTRNGIAMPVCTSITFIYSQRG